MFPHSHMRLALAFLAFAILSALAILPAAGSFFPNMVLPHSYSFGQYEFPGFGGVGMPPQAITVTAQDEGKTFEAAMGDTLTVTLPETDPHQVWRLESKESVQQVTDIVLESYPAQHKFTLKAVASGPVRFNLVDDRDGSIVKTFGFDLVVAGSLKAPQAPQKKRLSLNFDFMPAFAWPFE